jgi:hypothetical protein
MGTDVTGLWDISGLNITPLAFFQNRMTSTWGYLAKEKDKDKRKLLLIFRGTARSTNCIIDLQMQHATLPNLRLKERFFAKLIESSLSSKEQSDGDNTQGEVLNRNIEEEDMDHSFIDINNAYMDHTISSSNSSSSGNGKAVQDTALEGDDKQSSSALLSHLTPFRNTVHIDGGQNGLEQSTPKKIQSSSQTPVAIVPEDSFTSATCNCLRSMLAAIPVAREVIHHILLTYSLTYSLTLKYNKS